jgi:hypothetical protein
VFKIVLQKDLPSGNKVIDSVWSMKRKSNGTLHGRMHARGFKQVEGQLYNSTEINSPDKKLSNY